ncbi:hypothetical protein VKT23_020261 [Stygiomarasmius scandens]|uniref:Uncharacterized protein n=1 Tax=Marasmiellus scandens TaxID=2682957 RepID=A0ABR1IJE2_9AGAR
MGNTIIVGLTRVEFLKWCLTLHGMEDDYTPGPISGHVFLLSWTVGGMRNRPSIGTDHQLTTATENLKKYLITMDRFRNRKRPAESHGHSIYCCR